MREDPRGENDQGTQVERPDDKCDQGEQASAAAAGTGQHPDAYIEGGELSSLVATSLSTGSTGLAEVRRLCAAKGPEAEALLAQLLAASGECGMGVGQAVLSPQDQGKGKHQLNKGKGKAYPKQSAKREVY